MPINYAEEIVSYRHRLLELNEYSNFGFCPQSIIGWRKLRNIVQWTPFFQTYKNKQKYPWVQLAGHQGNFKAGSEPGTVLKKLSPKEETSFNLLMKDVLRPYVPDFKGVASGDEEDCKKYKTIAIGPILDVFLLLQLNTSNFKIC